MKQHGGDFAEDAQTAARYAELLAGGDPKPCAAFRRALLERFQRESWPQRRVLRLFQRVTTLLETKPRDPGESPPYREWFLSAVGMAATPGELEEIVKSLEAVKNAAGEGNETIGKVREYLQAHYAEHITGQTLAKKFGYVPSYLSFLFRQTYGQSPADYLTRLRLDKAKELLRGRPSPLVREVAEQVGYQEPVSFFARVQEGRGRLAHGFQRLKGGVFMKRIALAMVLCLLLSLAGCEPAGQETAQPTPTPEPLPVFALVVKDTVNPICR